MSDEGRVPPGADQDKAFGSGLPRLVYPVISRRSGGLSLGINLFPYGKVCNFDCPYCEVFAEEAGADSERGATVPSGGDPERRGAAPKGAGGGPQAPPSISIGRLESELADFADRAWPEVFAPESVRDICFSGNGEPTMSPSLEKALAAADRARRSHPKAFGNAKLVLITNSTGFLDEEVAGVLELAVDDCGLEIWAKLDAGSEDLFRLMSGTVLPLSRIAEGILSFASRRPIVIQSMLCEVAGRSPSDADARELGGLIASVAARGALIREIHAYTFARPTPGGNCAALGDARLAELAAEIARASGIAVRAFGSRGALDGTAR